MRDEDNDIAAALPKAPPPSPARRTAAIDTAMRRFDGIGTTPVIGRRQRETGRPGWWAGLGRPQLTGLVSAALVAVVGMPVAWFAIDRASAPPVQQPVAGKAGSKTSAAVASPKAEPGSQLPAVAASNPSVGAVPGPAPAVNKAEIVAPPLPVATIPSPLILPAPMVAPAPAPPPAADAAKDVIVTGTNIRGATPTGANQSVLKRDDVQATGQTKTDQLLASIPGFSQSNALPNNSGKAAPGGAQASKPNLRGAPDAPARAKAAQRLTLPAPRAPSPADLEGNGIAAGSVTFDTPPPAADAKRQAESSAGATRDVVITGATIRKRANTARTLRGEWNACTVNDPGKSLAACKASVNPAAAGTPGRAAAHVADGLTRGWQGDFDGAIAAFDAAIALSPRLALAYLNRGLAWQHKGDLGRALADLNLAIRYAPDTASGYFNRSLILNQRGDIRGAIADEEKAAKLDSDYEELFR